MNHTVPRVSRTAALGVILWSSCFCSSCGFASVGVAASANGDGGTANAPATASGLQVLGAKTSPATIRFELVDAEADAATVELAYVLPGQTGETRLTRVPANPLVLATGRQGTPQDVAWDFASEPGIATAALTRGVRLVARVNATFTQTTVVDLGNDGPEVSAAATEPEVSGIVAVRLTLRDSSADRVQVRAEYAIGNSSTYVPARPAGIDPLTPTPEIALTDENTSTAGVPLTFFWDTATRRPPPAFSGDLVALERPVRLRFTVVDPAGAAASTELAFVVDNNAAPIVQLGEEFVATPDDRRGIPVTLSIVDAESDPVRVVFQWRREDQSGFPPLGTNSPEVLASLLADPAWVRQKQVCTPFPSAVEGVVVHGGSNQVWLPEVQQLNATLQAGGLEFRRLQLLRNSPLAGMAATWSSNLLSAPAACAPIGDGTHALVLDRAGSGSRLLEVELGTGAVRRVVVSGLLGLPSALDVNAAGAQALVATDDNGTWQLFAVDLATGATSTVATAAAGGTTGPVGPLRGLLAIGTRRALVTAGNALWQIDWSGPLPTVTSLLGGLATPWGLALDPLLPGSVLIAQNTADILISFDLTTRARLNVPVATVGGLPALRRPSAIATDLVDGGISVLVLCETPIAGQREVRRLRLGQGDPAVTSLGVVPGVATSLCTGPAGLLVLALPDAADLVVGGGVEQVRTIVDFAADTATATVDTAFTPSLRTGQAWRIDTGRALFAPMRSSPNGEPARFVWDAGELGFQGTMQLRATPMDTEFARLEQTSISRTVQNFDLQRLDAGGAAEAAIAADLDGDGDLDLVAGVSGANDGALQVYRQDGPRSFVPGQRLSLSGGVTSLAAGDFDSDGDVDLACTADVQNTNELYLFRQVSPLTFSSYSVPLGSPNPAPRSVVAADLDRNGSLDLVCVNQLLGSITLVHQVGGVLTASSPLPVGESPVSVAAGDLDGDGDNDLVVARLLGGAPGLVLLFQVSPGQYQQQSVIPAPAPFAVAIADLDGDSDADLACSNLFAGRVSMFLQDQSGSFAAATALEVGSEPVALEVADLDGDGSSDLVCADRRSNQLSVFRQLQPGMFVAEAPLTTGALPGSVLAADLDGDGSTDLLSSNATSRDLSLFYRDAQRLGARDFAPEATVSTGLTPNALLCVDVDLDGDPDLLVADTGNDELTIHYQNSPRSFTARQSLSTDDEPAGLAAADLDGDGDVDLVAANALGDSLTIHYQLAPRQFAAKVSLPAAGSGPVAVAAADLDGDRDLDLICVNRDSDTITIFIRDAQGQYAVGSTLPTGDRPQFVAVADLDGDADLDFAVSNRSGNTLSLFRQSAPGTIEAWQTLGPAAGATSVVAADLDRDGDMDLVCGNEAGNGLSLFRQTSPGSFVVSSVPLVSASGPASVSVSDLDGDGDHDLATASFASGNVTIVYQQAPFVFVSEPPLTVVGGPIAILGADVDGDGDQDLAALKRLGNNFSVLYGRSR